MKLCRSVRVTMYVILNFILALIFLLSDEILNLALKQSAQVHLHQTFKLEKELYICMYSIDSAKMSEGKIRSLVYKFLIWSTLFSGFW